jgi:hypothetical protein
VDSGLTDTDVDSLRVQVDLLRRATPSRRLELAFALSADVISLSLAGIRRRQPGLSEPEAHLRFLAIHYGDELAERVRARVEGPCPS